MRLGRGALGRGAALCHQPAASSPYCFVSERSIRSACAGPASATGRWRVSRGTTKSSPAESWTGARPSHLDAEDAAPAQEELVLRVVVPGEGTLETRHPHGRLVDCCQVDRLPGHLEAVGDRVERDLGRRWPAASSAARSVRRQVQVRAEAVDAALAPVAGLLVAAERAGRVESVEGVGPHHAGAHGARPS